MITGIGHGAYGVADMERSLGFYCGGLGLREAFRLYNDDGETWIVYLHIGGPDFIELFPDPRVQGGPVPAGSYRHLCLMVDDITATLAALAARGVHADRPPARGKDHNWQAWLTDPDGNRIELMQIAPESPQWAVSSGKPVPVGGVIGQGPGPGDAR